MNESMNDKGVYRTAPATQGLLITTVFLERPLAKPVVMINVIGILWFCDFNSRVKCYRTVVECSGISVIDFTLLRGKWFPVYGIC